MTPHFINLNCTNCGAKPLDVHDDDDMERFACGYCGTEIIVQRRGGTVAHLRLRAPKECVGDQPPVCVARASRQRDPRVPVPGTQLIKRYKNETLTVTVLEDGYQYGERVYKSLSAIARQVTGTQWNGYVFFALGLRKEMIRGE